MARMTKRAKRFAEKVVTNKVYPITEAVDLLTELASTKFKESMDVSINLGVDPRKSDQIVRGATVLPNGTGKDVRVAVFARDDKAEAAKEAGADVVGIDDLAASMQAGNLNYDVVIATPDAMRVVSQLGRLLGPKGLMPNPRLGTVTPDVAGAVKNAKSGQVRYRTDKNGIIHGGVGKIGFESWAIKENVEALLVGLKKAKPASAKGIYVKKVVLSTTMGAGIPIDQSSLEF